MLNSILDQTVKIDQISMNIPEESKNKKYTVPTEYKNVCNVYKAGKDYGPGTKYIPTLLREENKDTIIILLDEKYVFGKDYIEIMIEEYKKDKCSIVSKGGILITPEFFDMDIYKREENPLNNKWIKDQIKVDKKNISSSDTYKICNY
jgi:hypothetical protein